MERVFLGMHCLKEPFGWQRLLACGLQVGMLVMKS